jgi:hypothetical protein
MKYKQKYGDSLGAACPYIGVCEIADRWQKGDYEGAGEVAAQTGIDLISSAPLPATAGVMAIIARILAQIARKMPNLPDCNCDGDTPGLATDGWTKPDITVNRHAS